MFRKTLVVYGRIEQVVREDANGKSRKKAGLYKAALNAGSEEYAHDVTHDELLASLFPELFISAS